MESRMDLGIHVVERARVAPLASAGLAVPTPWMGILDALRMIEGHLPEPPEGQALGVVGLEALVRAGAGPATALLQAVREGLAEARRYFSWKRIPLVLVVDGDIEDPRDGSGLWLSDNGGRWALAPALGTRLEPVAGVARGWWWSPQIG